jgi:sulfonate transport system ATP-binding protein
LFSHDQVRLLPAAFPMRDGPTSASRSADAVVLQGVTRRFGNRAVLDNLDLTIRRTEFVALLGPSGTGKTTLLRILAGLDRADEGKVLVARNRSVVFQEPRLVPAKRVWQNVVIGHPQNGASRLLALKALGEVGLERHADAWPKTLSGGEAQRVALARALVSEPQLLLLDEPFAALDALTRIKMHDLVARLCAVHHPAVVLVTHDVDEAILLADRIVMMSDGSIGLDVEVDLAGPRSRTSVAFATLRAQLLAQLGVEPVVDPVLIDGHA